MRGTAHDTPLEGSQPLPTATRDWVGQRGVMNSDAVRGHADTHTHREEGGDRRKEGGDRGRSHRAATGHKGRGPRAGK